MLHNQSETMADLRPAEDKRKKKIQKAIDNYRELLGKISRIRSEGAPSRIEEVIGVCDQFIKTLNIMESENVLKKKMEEAIEVCSNLIELKQTNAYEERGLYYLELLQFEKAISDFNSFRSNLDANTNQDIFYRINRRILETNKLYAYALMHTASDEAEYKAIVDVCSAALDVENNFKLSNDARWNSLELVEVYYLRAKSFFLLHSYDEANLACNKMMDILDQHIQQHSTVFLKKTSDQYETLSELCFSNLKKNIEVWRADQSFLNLDKPREPIAALIEIYELNALILEASKKYQEAMKYYELAIRACLYYLTKEEKNISKWIRSKCNDFYCSKGLLDILMNNYTGAEKSFNLARNDKTSEKEGELVSKHLANLYVLQGQSQSRIDQSIEYYDQALKTIRNYEINSYLSIYETCFDAHYKKIESLEKEIESKKTKANHFYDQLLPHYDQVIFIISRTNNKILDKDHSYLYYDRGMLFFSHALSNLNDPLPKTSGTRKFLLYNAYKDCSDAIKWNPKNPQYFSTRSDICVFVALETSKDKVNRITLFLESFNNDDVAVEFMAVQVRKNYLLSMKSYDKQASDQAYKAVRSELCKRAFSDYLQTLFLSPYFLEENTYFKKLLSIMSDEDFLSVINTYPKEKQILLLESCLNGKHILNGFIKNRGMFNGLSKIITTKLNELKQENQEKNQNNGYATLNIFSQALSSAQLVVTKFSGKKSQSHQLNQKESKMKAGQKPDDFELQSIDGNNKKTM